MRTTLLTIALALATGAPARAQEALPDLTPREFEIQGDLQVDFSGIQRQPLTGFGPPPRAYVVPAERTPTERIYGFPLEQIAVPTLAPQPLPTSDLLRPLSAYVEGLAGAYAGRAARLRLQQNSTTGAFYLDADYDGASTYTPFDADVSDGTMIYNRLGGTAGYHSHAGWQVEAGGRLVDHELYGAAFVTPGLAPPILPQPVALPAQPARTATHTFAAATYGDDSRPITVTARYDFASATTDLDGFAIAPGMDTDDPSEGRFTADGHARWNRVHVDAHGSFAGTDAALGSDVTGYSAGAAFELAATDRSSLVLGARVLGAEGPLGTTTAVGPVVRFELRPRRGSVRVFAENAPQVLDQGLASVFATNPFAEPTPLVTPEVQPVNARAGVQTQIGAARTTLYGGAQWGERTRFFERDAATGLFTVGYGEAQRFFGGIEAAFGRPERVEATVGLEGRSGRLVDADADLPYYAPIVAHATVSATLLDRRLRLSAQARAEAARPADRIGTEAPGFFDLSVDMAYSLSERLDVLLRAGGLAGEVERWAGYLEAPFTVLGGVRARW